MKTYRVSESEHFNLMSMYDHLMAQVETLRCDPDADVKELEALEDRVAEVSDLLDKAYCVGARVTWPVLERVRAIQQERREIRYATCLAAGADEPAAAIALTL